MTFKDLLEFLFTRGLPMIGVYWLLDRPFLLRWLENAELFFKVQLGLNMSVVKRAIAMVLSVGLSAGAYAIYAGLGYADLPINFEGWANLLLYLASVTYAGSQVIHGYKDMK
jgi:hypothetical protein